MEKFSHLHDKNEGCRAANFRHRGQIQTGTVPKKLSCKPGFRRWVQCAQVHTWNTPSRRAAILVYTRAYRMESPAPLIS